MTCKCSDCTIDLSTVVHLDDGDVCVTIHAKGLDDFTPDHHACALAVRRVVEENIVAPYKEVMGGADG